MSTDLKQQETWPEPVIRRHPRARRMKLRVDPESGQAQLTLPTGLAERAGHAFIRENESWIAAQRARLIPRQPFIHGLEIPLLGQPVAIVHDPDMGRKVLLDGVLLRVGGPADHVNRRVTEWLKSQARDRLIRLAPPLAAQIGRQVGQIRVADPRTRWGSCSGRGTLSFNWRLVLAPEHVFDYVCAHEVAHLKHMDHSPAFWAVVARLHDDPSRAQAWLKDNGRALRGWG